MALEEGGGVVTEEVFHEHQTLILQEFVMRQRSYSDKDLRGGRERISEGEVKNQTIVYSLTSLVTRTSLLTLVLILSALAMFQDPGSCPCYSWRLTSPATASRANELSGTRMLVCSKAKSGNLEQNLQSVTRR